MLMAKLIRQVRAPNNPGVLKWWIQLRSNVIYYYALQQWGVNAFPLANFGH